MAKKSTTPPAAPAPPTQSTTGKTTDVIFSRADAPREEVEPVAAAPEPEQTEAELAQLAAETMRSLGYEDPKPKKVEPPAAAAPAVPEKKVEPPAPTTPKTKPKTEKPDPKALAKEVSDAVVDRLTAQQPPAPPAAREPEVASADQHLRDVVAVMAEKPEFKHLTAELESFLAKEANYKKAWSRDNPGQTFNPDADAHAEFYDKHEPQHDPRAFDVAEAKLELRNEMKQERQREQEAQRAEHTKQTVQTTAREAADTAVKDMVKAAAPDLKDFDGDFTKLEEDEPFVAEVLQDNALALKTLVDESYRLLTPELRVVPNESNPVHREILRRVYHYETALADKPASETKMDGKEFATIETFSHMTPAQQKQHWTLWNQPGYLTKCLAKDFTQLSSERIEKYRKNFDRVAQKRGLTAAQAASQATQPANGAPAAEATPAAARSAPPNTSSAADLGTIDPSKLPKTDDWGVQVAKALWG